MVENITSTTILRTRGFSLVELAIVLVILGLLVGGVLTGRVLIRASELRTVTTQYQGNVTAARSFRDKYFMLPGDMNNATQFWGIAAGTGSDATCGAFSSTTAATCNGNGIIDDADILESLRFWQHLANAGMIEGSYPGTNVAGVINSQPSKISNNFWYVYSRKFTPGGPMLFGDPGVYFDVDYGNYMRIAALNANTFTIPEDVYHIDMKFDDGKPGSGSIITIGNRFLNSCTTTSSSYVYTADYLMAGTTTCGLIFRQAF